MKTLYSIFILLFTLSFNLEAQKWTQRSDFAGSARIAASAFTNGDYGYICLGSSNTTYYNDLWQYDPQLGSWTKKDSFPAAKRRTAVAFTIDTLSYVGLGWNDQSNRTYDDVLSYNPKTGIWDTVAKFPGLRKRNAKAVSYNGKGYVAGGGGIPGSSRSNELWEYDPVNDQWTKKANMNTSKAAGVMFVIDTLIYYSLGHNSSVDYDDLWSYDITTNLWTKRASFPGDGRLNATAFVLNGKAIVGGGYRLGVTAELNDYYSYDPITDSWDTLGSFADGARSVSSAFTINDTGYIACGWDTVNAVTNNFWSYSDTSVLVGINKFKFEETEDITIKAYPNPSNGRLTLEFPSTEDKILQLYDLLGKQMMHQRISTDNKRYELNLTDLKKGNYLYRVVDQQSAYTGIIVVE